MIELEMFAKLPQLDEDCEVSNRDIDYAPTLSSRSNKELYYIYIYIGEVLLIKI